MPELPEVQTIVNYLGKRIMGLRITDVWTDPVKPVKTGHGAGWPKIKEELKDKKILSVRRRAKYIIMDIEGAKTLFIHQKISGHLLYGKWIRQPADGGGKWISQIPGPLKDDRQNGYIRFVLYLNNGYQLALSDLRRFGKVILVNDERVKDLKEISELGPEPLDISFDQFEKLFDPSAGLRARRKRGRVKQVLMDQTFIAGIGNIYSDEILWDAGYHPLSRVENLKEPDLKKIFNSSVKILKKAIKYQGSSMDDYRMPSGRRGSFQNVQNAYQLTGEKCKKKDGGIIKRLKLGGRSAHFCPEHQILK